MAMIVFEDGRISLGGREVPGILTELRVDGKVRFDEHKVDGNSGKTKIPQGYEDSDIMIGLLLLTDNTSDCYEKASELNGMFRDTDSHANPQVLTVVNRHLQARASNRWFFPGWRRRRTTRPTKSGLRWPLLSTCRRSSRMRKRRPRRLRRAKSPMPTRPRKAPPRKRTA